jgi:mono/diheme cytochrome c family protein
MIDSLYQFLAKLGYTDPLHAPVTHMPIGLIFGALVFLLVAIIFKRQNLVLTARHAAILAFVMVFPTILFGVFDWLHFFKGALITAIKVKMVLASVVLVALAVGVILGNEVKMRSWLMTMIYAIAFLSAIGLGWYGAGLYPGTVKRGGNAEAGGGQSQTGLTMTVSPARAAVQAGQTIFSNNCQSCHADGGNIVAPNSPLKSSRQLASRDTFVSFIRSPKMPNGSAGDMPPFPKDQVDDVQADNLYQYIESMVQTSWK